MLLKQLYIVNYTCLQSQLLQRTISIYHTNNYKLSHTDWTESFSYVINKITVPPDPKSIALCNTIRELCEIRDGTKQCEILLNIEFVEALIAQLCVE